jgi:hypothetical protein
VRLLEVLQSLWEGRADPPGISRRAWEWAVLLFAFILFLLGIIALIAALAYVDAYLPKSQA